MLADGPASTTVSVTVTDDDLASDTDSIVVTVANVAPQVAYTSSPATADEGQTKTYQFSVTDPGVDTYAASAGFPDCGTGGSLVALSFSVSGNSGSQTGQFQCSFADGPASPDVRIRFTDSDTDAGNIASQSVTVANVAPQVAYTSSPATADEGQTKTYQFSVTDPGVDTYAASAGFPDCGTGGSLVALSFSVSGNSGSQTGQFQCSFADGTGSADVRSR